MNEGYPNSPGFKTLETETSYQAAKAVSVQASELREQCRAVLEDCPRTADEVASVLGRSVLAIRPRISELVKMGLVGKTDERRRNESGKKAVVWKAVK